MALEILPRTSVVSTTVLEIDQLIRARFPVVNVVTHEEQRFHALMATVAQLPKHSEKGLFTWSRTCGIREITPGRPIRDIPETFDPMAALDHIAEADTGLFILDDFGPYIAGESPSTAMTVRRLREIAFEVKGRPVTVFLCGPNTPDVPGLEKEVWHVDLPLPDESEIAVLLESQANDLAGVCPVDLTGEIEEQIVAALLGLTESEIGNALAKTVITHMALDARAVSTIIETKRNVIRKSGSVEYSDPQSPDKFGGYAWLKELAYEAQMTLTPAAREYGGIDPFSGVFLIGPPGGGKTYAARMFSSVLGRPLLQTSMGEMMGAGGGIIGQGATQWKQVRELATTLKAVLLFDEFEKGFATTNAASDGGETERTTGPILQWLATQRGVFVMATANDVRGLRPELLRTGRFDRVEWLGPPSTADRQDIFRVQIAMRGRNPEDYDTARLAAESPDFMASEIEGAVKAGFLAAFKATMHDNARREPSTEDISAALPGINTIMRMKGEQIAEIQAWAVENLGVTVVSERDAVMATARQTVRKLDI